MSIEKTGGHQGRRVSLSKGYQGQSIHEGYRGRGGAKVPSQGIRLPSAPVSSTQVKPRPTAAASSSASGANSAKTK